jgi:hypothetical protein
VSSLLQNDDIVLNTTIARAICRIAKTFGINGDNVELQHIKEFVERMADGFQIRDNSPHNVRNRTYAAAFATDLGHPRHRVQDVIDAFLEGMEAGNDTIKHFASRRRRITS